MGEEDKGREDKDQGLGPTDLNAVFRLLLVAKNCGPQFLYDADRMNHMFGRRSPAELDSPVFNEARRIIESPAG